MEPSRNYNLNRPIDENTEAFESELGKLIEKYEYTNMTTETFGEE